MAMPILRITHISWVCGNGLYQANTSSSRSATGIKLPEYTKKSLKALMGHTLVDVKMPASCILIVSKMHSNGLKRHQLRNNHLSISKKFAGTFLFAFLQGKIHGISRVYVQYQMNLFLNIMDLKRFYIYRRVLK